MNIIQTFAQLQQVKVKESQRFTCVERANAEYVVQPSGYIALAGDVTFANGLVGALQINGDVNVRSFGAKLDGIQDDAPFFNAALSRFRNVYYDNGCLTESTILMGLTGSTLYSTSQENYITANFTGAPVIQVLRNKSAVRNCGIRATGARLASSFNKLNVGILLGGSGSSSVLNGCTIENNQIAEQSGHGIYLATNCNDTRIARNLVTRCRGHGFIMDDGTDNGVAVFRNGIVNFDGNIAQSCGGYGIALSPSGGSSCYRVIIDNIEITDCSWNATEMGISLDFLSYIWGQNIDFRVGAINDSGYAATTLSNGEPRYAKVSEGGAILVKSPSKSLSFRNPRFLDVSKGLQIDSDTDGFEFINNFNGSSVTLSSNVRISTGVDVTNYTIKTSSELVTTPVSVPSGKLINAVIDDVNISYFGTQSFTRGLKTTPTVSGGGFNAVSNILSPVGEGGVADSISFINASGTSYPIQDGEIISFLNENAYTLTMVEGSFFNHKSGANIVLSTGDAISYRKIGSIYYEV